MTEISQHKEQRLQQLEQLFDTIYYGTNIRETVLLSAQAIEEVKPGDIISLVHRLMERELPMKPLKTAVNKFINLLGRTIKTFELPPIDPNSFIGCSRMNYSLLDQNLKEMKVSIRRINSDSLTSVEWDMLYRQLLKVSEFQTFYLIKENCLFPLIEKKLEDFRCVQLMWSFHDDIRRNLKELTALVLVKEPDLGRINRLLGEVYFNIYAIKLRDENILFPHLLDTMGSIEIDRLLPQCLEIGFPYVQPELLSAVFDQEQKLPEGYINFPTGAITIEQILLIFNHLPVDITFVDQDDQVKFYSTPQHRIFPRSKAIIGRNVHHCHPKESVHIVEEIIKNFRTGRKKEASFWIQMKEQFVLIRYFAIFDADGIYRGVLEVSQEVSGIRKLEGEQRLLNWTSNL